MGFFYLCMPPIISVAILVGFPVSEYHVSESNVTMQLRLTASEKSEFDYKVYLMLTDITTSKLQ